MLLSGSLALLALSYISSINAAPTTPSISSLPTIDLGYEIHEAISFNESGGYYNFSNIRYAEPPVGDLRFRAPVAVSGKSKTVNNGSVGKICPQALPGWFPEAEAFVPDYLSGKSFVPPASSATASSTAPDPRMDEDCLFLDVIVPQSILQSSEQTAPVLVWIYGGGYVFGDKTEYDPAGLLAASSKPFIFVAMNYRLGAFGWLSGPSVQVSGTAQPALLDQRMALHWVQDNIHLFGGDKSKVTVMGESAGGGSTMHQITAYGGARGPAPFQRAIIQSPAFYVNPSPSQSENTTQTFMSLCNVSSISELRILPSSDLILANAQQIASSKYGAFTYGPVIDGTFVPALPGQLLLTGAFDKSISILASHNSDEGLLFTSPSVNSSTGLAEHLEVFFNTMSTHDRSFVENSLYPPVFDGSQPYTNEYDRVKLLVSDTFVSCNAGYLLRAPFASRPYGYEFSVFPGMHGEDLTYTFNNGKTEGTVDSIATTLQEYLTSFVTDGAPIASNAPAFPQSGFGSKELVNIGSTAIVTQADETANERCAFWQKQF